MSAHQAEWIAVDWGTSNLRTWVFGPGRRLIAAHAAPRGMGRMTREEFEPALLSLVGEHLGPDRKTPVIACGMVGARQGWAEATYARTPCPPPGPAEAVTPKVLDPRIDVRILPGVAQASPPDVMRGEETQIGGYLAADPDFDGVIALPGTHTKWVHISAGEIVSFQTVMTGELFSLLSRNSILRFSVEGSKMDEAAFDEAVADALSNPQYLTSRFFGIRAGSLLDGLPPAMARGRLSGLLIGAELAGTRPYWLGRKVVLIGDGRLCGLYARALAAQGVAAGRADGDAMVLDGLRAAHRGLRGKA